MSRHAVNAMACSILLLSRRLFPRSKPGGDNAFAIERLIVNVIVALQGREQIKSHHGAVEGRQRGKAHNPAVRKRLRGLFFFRRWLL